MPKRLVNLASDVLLDGNNGGTGIDADELSPGLVLLSTGIPGAPWLPFPFPTPTALVIEDEGAPIPGAPHTVLNFVGAGVMAMDAGSGVVDIVIPGGGTALLLLVFQADQFENPNNADWAVNSLAPAQAGPTNAALTVRAFDDTTPEGIGFSAAIPAGATSMIFKFKSRAAAAPGAPTTVTPRLYRRTIPDNLAVTAWSALLAMTAIDIPTNIFYQYDSQTITLATLGLTAGNQAQFEITRAPGGLVGDWLLLSLEISFT